MADYGQQKAKKFKKGSFTATQTGARAAALAKNTSMQQKAANSGTAQTTKGTVQMGDDFGDVESMIDPSLKRKRPTRSPR